MSGAGKTVTMDQFVRTLLWVTTKRLPRRITDEEMSKAEDALFEAGELGRELLKSEQFSIITAEIEAAKMLAKLEAAEKAAKKSIAGISDRRREVEAVVAMVKRTRQDWEQNARKAREAEAQPAAKAPATPPS